MTARVLGRRFGPLLVVVSILVGCASTGSNAGNGSTTQFTEDDQCKRSAGSGRAPDASSPAPAAAHIEW
jgi:hypothetical protein